MRADAARAAQDRHSTVAVDHRSQPFELISRWRCDRRGLQQPVDLQWRRFSGRLKRDVPWQDHHRHAPFAYRFADCNLEHARHLVGAGHKLTVMAAFLEQCLRMGFLEVAAANLG